MLLSGRLLENATYTMYLLQRKIPTSAMLSMSKTARSVAARMVCWFYPRISEELLEDLQIKHIRLQAADKACFGSLIFALLPTNAVCGSVVQGGAGGRR